jgi:hypothetical protein
MLTPEPSTRLYTQQEGLTAACTADGEARVDEYDTVR